MTEAAQSRLGTGLIGDASWVTWLRIQLARVPNAARSRAAERERESIHEQPAGLLSGDEPGFHAAAMRVATSAPRQFGRLDEVLLRGRFVLRGDDISTLDELVREAVRIAAEGFAASGPRSSDVAALEARLRYADDFLKRREGEIARRKYARGLLGGVILTAVALAVIGGVGAAVITLWRGGPMPPDQADALRDVLVAVGAGAAGACVSVLLRMHKMGNLPIEVADGGAARYRIVLGWFFAAAVVFLLKSGLLSVVFVIPEGRVESWFFWGSVGFLAGFNERWATNLISRRPEDVGSDAAPDAGTTGSRGK
ncbi:hypothetical protein Q9R08_17125 [Microbacterium sp. QXD-8]|uniref:Uncharacterized protein n=1 Tax=Microbacterium psychrotolerans TaxID=3068321 RepID=A0ABU0Z537_9MICO|nr:hypothetical protein [Microbacterium sp. QXD-8]MDQ7879717.1 hypothetical protein [Microbacterium sp. QXD-8]